MTQFQHNAPVHQGNSGGASPFDRIRHVDAYGREYWLGREMQPLMGYPQWVKFEPVIEKAKTSLAIVQGEAAAQNHFSRMGKMVPIGSGAEREVPDFRLTRFGAYLTAMAGDDTKEAVAQARVYFAVRAREAELGALTELEIRRTALARAREMVDYRLFRDMMAENAPDYMPSSKTTQIFFGAMQNKLYRHITGMTAKEITKVRSISTWKGCEDGKSPTKKDREVAKNYLSRTELEKLDRMVARLCLRAEDIADDRVNLRLDQWSDLVDIEISTATRPLGLPAA